MHAHPNVIKCFYLVPLLFQESTFLELFPKRTNEGKVLLVFATTIHTFSMASAVKSLSGQEFNVVTMTINTTALVITY